MTFDIRFFGSSLVSAYWNGAATYYRGILRALAARGHRITFYEPDVYDRQRHRDIPDPPWAEVVVYPGTRAGVQRLADPRPGSPGPGAGTPGRSPGLRCVVLHSHGPAPGRGVAAPGHGL